MAAPFRGVELLGGAVELDLATEEARGLAGLPIGLGGQTREIDVIEIERGLVGRYFIVGLDRDRAAGGSAGDGAVKIGESELAILVSEEGCGHR